MCIPDNYCHLSFTIVGELLQEKEKNARLEEENFESLQKLLKSKEESSPQPAQQNHAEIVEKKGKGTRREEVLKAQILKLKNKHADEISQLQQSCLQWAHTCKENDLRHERQISEILAQQEDVICKSLQEKDELLQKVMLFIAIILQCL